MIDCLLFKYTFLKNYNLSLILEEVKEWLDPEELKASEKVIESFVHLD